DSLQTQRNDFRNEHTHRALHPNAVLQWLNRRSALGRCALFLLIVLVKIPRRLDELHLEPFDPRALDLDHPEAKAIVSHLVALGSGPAEQAEDEPRDRVVVLIRQ